MTRKATEYVAVSTVNAQMSGWSVLARGTDPRDVIDAAYAEIDRQYPDRLDLYGDTLRKNVVVTSLTKARRIAGRCALSECDHDHGYAEE